MTSQKSRQESFNVGYVVWDDAMHSRSQTHVVQHEPYKMVTAGIIVKDDAKGISMAMDFSEEGAFRDITFIPRGMVREVKVLGKDVVSRAPQIAVMPMKEKA